MGDMGWTSVSLKEADYILAVCRSSLYYPLSGFYSSITDLDRDADMQLNISGPNMHVYVYEIGDDLSVSQIEHKYWEAD